MSEHENEDSSSESEVSENPDPQIKVGEQILQTIQAIRECKTKKLKLLTSLEADDSIPEADVLSLHKEVTITTRFKLLHKRILELCLMSNDLTSKKYLSRNILNHLTYILNREAHSLKLLEENSAILKERIKLNLKYDQNLQDYRDFTEEQRVKNAEKMQKTNPKMAEEIRRIKLRIKKINIINRTIISMHAGAVHWIEDDNDLRELMREIVETVRLEDFEQSEKES